MTEEKKTLSIEVDRSKVTLGDMWFIAKLGNANGVTSDKMDRMFSMLDRIVVGGIEDIPYDAMDNVMQAVTTALNADTDIKN